MRDQEAEARLLEVLVNRKAAEAPRDNSYLRLSGAGDCSRKIGFRMLATPSAPPTPQQLATFEIGHAYHAMVQDWLIDAGYCLPALIEFPFRDDEARLKGTADAITERLDDQFKLSLTGYRRVVDIKSMTNREGDEWFGKTFEEGSFDRLKAPRDYQLDQLTAYAMQWNRLVLSHLGCEGWDHFGRLIGPFTEDDLINHVMVVYVAKDQAAETPLKVFTQKLSSKRVHRLTDKFVRIWEALDAGEVPSRDYDPWSKFSPCSMCDYHALCVLDGRTDEGPSLFDVEVPTDAGIAPEDGQAWPCGLDGAESEF